MNIIKSFFTEFKKIKHKKILLIVLIALAIQVLWVFRGSSEMSDKELAQGWMAVFYQFSILNAIIMPIFIAVIASRLSDIEHKGSMLKLLETLSPSGKIYDSKLLCGATFALLIIVLQIIFIILGGWFYDFSESFPFFYLLIYLLFMTMANFAILIFQQNLSLIFKNQIIALSTGIIGSLGALYLLFVPSFIKHFIVWGYYSALISVRMDWNPETEVLNYQYLPINWHGFICLIILSIILYIVGKFLFMRKKL